MNWALACFIAASVAGCGSNRQPEGAAGSGADKVVPAQAGQPVNSGVTDEQIGLPVYPGAKEVEYSRVKLTTDIGESYGVSYTTSDTPLQVAAFYQAEAAKLGKLREAMPTGDQLQSIAVDRTDGTQSAIQAMAGAKGSTIVTIHRFFPKQ